MGSGGISQTRPENSTRPLFTRALLVAVLVGPWILFGLFYLARPQSDLPPLDIPPTGPLTIAATGDALLFNPLDDAERDPEFLRVRDTIRTATFAIASLDLNLLGPDEAKRAVERSTPRW